MSIERSLKLPLMSPREAEEFKQRVQVPMLSPSDADRRGEPMLPEKINLHLPRLKTPQAGTPRGLNSGFTRDANLRSNELLSLLTSSPPASMRDKRVIRRRNSRRMTDRASDHIRDFNEGLGELTHMLDQRTIPEDDGGSGLWSESDALPRLRPTEISGTPPEPSSPSAVRPKRSPRRSGESVRRAEAKKQLEAMKGPPAGGHLVIKTGISVEVAEKIARLRADSDALLEFDRKVSEMMRRQRAKSAASSVDLVGQNSSRVWDANSPRSLEKRRSERAAALRERMEAAASKAELLRARAHEHFLENINRQEMLADRKRRAEEYQALMSRQTAWLVLLALGARSARLGGRVVSGRTNRRLSSFALRIQRVAKRWLLIRRVAKVAAARRLLRNYVWVVRLKLRCNAKRLATDKISNFLLLVASHGALSMAVKAFMYKVVLAQRIARSVAIATEAQLELLVMQCVREMERRNRFFATPSPVPSPTPPVAADDDGDDGRAAAGSDAGGAGEDDAGEAAGGGVGDAPSRSASPEPVPAPPPRRRSPSPEASPYRLPPDGLGVITSQQHLPIEVIRECCLKKMIERRKERIVIRDNYRRQLAICSEYEKVEAIISKGADFHAASSGPRAGLPMTLSGRIDVARVFWCVVSLQRRWKRRNREREEINALTRSLDAMYDRMVAARRAGGRSGSTWHKHFLRKAVLDEANPTSLSETTKRSGSRRSSMLPPPPSLLELERRSPSRIRRRATRQRQKSNDAQSSVWRASMMIQGEDVSRPELPHMPMLFTSDELREVLHHASMLELERES